MKKNFLYVALGLMGLMVTLAIGVGKAEYSQVINITGTNGDIIQSFEQKWEDLEVYFLDDAGKVNHYTMMDRNMGATEIYNGDFSTGGINTGSFGYHYQWGNNYGFAPCIAIGESCDTFPNGETTTNTRVPKSVWMLYVPSNYANNKWNRNDPRMESSVENHQNNDNLWGGSGDKEGSQGIGNTIDRRGPCPNGYYVPSVSNLGKLVISRNKYSPIKSGNKFASDLLLPLAGYRQFGGGTMYNQGKSGIYLSSSPAATQYMAIYSVTCGMKIEATKVSITYPEYGESMDTDMGIRRGNGNSVRCFKGTENNNYNIYGNGGTGAVIIIHGDKVLTLSNPMNRTGIFVGWYDANEGGNEVKEGDTAPRNLYARWDCYEGYELSGGCVPKKYKINYELNGGELAELIGEYTIESGDISLKHPSKSGYIFMGWSGTDIDGYSKDVVILAGSVGDKNYEANRGCNSGYVENSEGTACEKIKIITEFNANGGKFSGGLDVISVGTIDKMIIPEKSKKLHTINLTDEGEYKFWSTTGANPDSCTYHSGGNGSGNTEIYGPSAEYIQIDGATELQLFIKYGGSSYCNPGPIGIWTGQHTDYDPRNPNHSGSAVWYISEFPAYGTFRTNDFVVQGDSISIVQSSGCPNYGWYVTATKDAVYEVVYETGAFDNIPQPTREGHSFKGWYLTDGTEFNTGSVSTGEVTYVYAKWECANGYEDKGGECVKKSSGSSGGGSGGGGGNSSKTDTGSTSGTGNQINSNTGDTASTGTNIKEPETNTGSNAQTGSQQPLSPTDSSPDREQTVTSLIGGDGEARGGGTQDYSPEFQEAYEFAKGKGITTMPTIQKADMNGRLTRIAMAKMLSQYAINVLGKTPDTTQNNKFNDVTEKLDSDYDDGVTLAYQLGIMGQNMPGNNFRPNDEVTRAEFATALSRMAYGTSDGEYRGTGKYYIHHMEKLVKEGIITKDDPNMKELRGYVMIMLMRSAKK